MTLSSLKRNSERQTPPVALLPPASTHAKIQKGDSLGAFLKRHGVTQQELKTFNPGLEFNALTIGRELQVAQASSGQSLLAVRPLRSGAAAWPEQTLLPAADQPDSLKPPIVGYQWPTKGVFTSGYGWRWGRMHKGIDIANNTGTPVVASRDGIVSYSGWSGAYGSLVEIAHSDGEFTRYAHNSRLLVKKGQVVPSGARISLMGSTGRSTGPHLHFEIRRAGGAALDPLIKLPETTQGTFRCKRTKLTSTESTSVLFQCQGRLELPTSGMNPVLNQLSYLTKALQASAHHTSRGSSSTHVDGIKAVAERFRLVISVECLAGFDHGHRVWFGGSGGDIVGFAIPTQTFS